MSTDSEQDNIDLLQQDGELLTSAELTKVTGNPLSVEFPPEQLILSEARRLAGDKNAPVNDLALCASQDPVLVLEMIKVANAMFFSGGKSPITTVRTAIQRIGSDVVIETLEKLKDRKQIESPEVSYWFETQRSRCQRTSIVAKILAEATTRTLGDDCQVAGVLLFIGELLAVAHFGEAYVALAQEMSRSGINYRLAQDYKFDTERMSLSYLRRFGIPEALLFAVDREARPPNKERAILRPVVFAAGEIIDAFDANRWEKLAPGRTLPPKSSLRLLQLPDTQYLKVYERASEYLFSAKLIEAKKRNEAEQGQEKEAAQEQVNIVVEAAKSSNLQAEIQNLLKGVPAGEEEPAILEPPPTNATSQIAPNARENIEEFNLKPEQKSAPKAARKQKVSVESAKPLPTSANPGAQRVIGKFTAVLETAQNGEELLTNTLQMLVQSGTFEKTALIVVSKDRSKAKVVAARGPDIVKGQTLIIDDPLSPLASCFSKVQSFGNRKSKVSPFGSCAFAVAPIDADHDTPVALYADCGDKGPVSFEARRIFRTVVEILNEKLPQIPGGIPVEI